MRVRANVVAWERLSMSADVHRPQRTRVRARKLPRVYARALFHTRVLRSRLGGEIKRAIERQRRFIPENESQTDTDV